VVGESRRPVPTAASVAAPDPGPLAWPASSLRCSSHGRAGSRHTAGRAAPPVRVSGASPGLSTDPRLQRTGRSTDRFFADPDQDRTSHQTRPHELQLQHEHHTTTTRAPKLACCPPYISWGSALRPSPFLAPPSFEPFREASRKGAFLSSQRLTPRIHQSRASRLALPVTPTAEKKAGKNPRTIGVPSCSLPRVLGPFSTRKGS